MIMSSFTNLKYKMNFLHTFYIKLKILQNLLIFIKIIHIKCILNIILEKYKFINIHVSIFSTEIRSHSLKKNHFG